MITAKITTKLNSKSHHSIRGMTLIELLVGMALMSFILLGLLTMTLRTNSASLAVQSRTDLTSETQIAQNYIASKIRNATYVFPYGTTLPSYFVLANSGYSTYNPRTSNYNWRLGAGTMTADPFIAFIVPPTGGTTVTSGSCNVASALTDPDAKAAEQNQKCYAFYAYYAVPRSQLVTGVSGDVPKGPNNVGADSTNDSTAWVLMEYRGFYASGAYVPGTTPAVSGIPTGGTGRVVLDYLRPTTETGTDKLFIGSTTPVQAVQIQLATTRQVGSQQINVPASGRFAVNVYPRNLKADPIVN